jgi:hypothetical protein
VEREENRFLRESTLDIALSESFFTDENIHFT